MVTGKRNASAHGRAPPDDVENILLFFTDQARFGRSMPPVFMLPQFPVCNHDRYMVCSKPDIIYKKIRDSSRPESVAASWGGAAPLKMSKNIYNIRSR
jgi:hypothetical protein